jgi:two-component system sensor histidine kinase ChiS
MKQLQIIAVLVIMALPYSHTYAQQPAIVAVITKAANFINNGSPDSAVTVADAALQLAIKHSDHKSQINAMRIKGKALFDLKKNKEAVDQYFDGLRICKAGADDKEAAMLYREIGYSYFSQGHPREAKDYYEKELAIKKALYGADSVGEQLLNLAVMHDQLKERDSAYMRLKDVDGILRRTNNTPLRGYYYINLGALLQTEGKVDSAEHCYHLAYAAWQAVGNEKQIYKVTFNLGFLAEQRKKYKEAINYYRLSEAAAKKFGFQTEIAHVYGTMAEAYAAISDYKNAYQYLYQYATINDSLNKGEFNTYIMKLDKEFQTDKNKETIHQQQLKLNEAVIQVQKQRNHVLIIIVALITVIFIAVITFIYLTFRSRVKKQVELAKSKFFSNVVHEIRTPLSMIQGPIKMLQASIADPEQRYQLNIAERNTNRLNDLINQMLDLSRIETATYHLNESIGDPRFFLEEIVRQYEHAAKEKNITILQQVETSEGNWLFDKDALEKITGNLLGNAIKYTPPGGMVGIDITGAREAGIQNLVISIWDTGIGIRKDDQEKIFSRFFRAKEQVEAGTKGLGIGLALVKDLVSLMGGSIAMESSAGQGAVFTVKLSLHQATLPTENAHNLAAAHNTILLVEDDTDILEFNRRLLISQGFNVITASNGAEASIVLQDLLPDLVITDLMMPGKDGLALIKEIRASPLTDHIPVIVLSAKTAAQAKMEVITAGVQVYLSKPFLPDELIALVRNQLQLLQKPKNHYQQQSIKADQTIEERFSGSEPFTKQCFNLIIEHLDDAGLTVERLAALMNSNRSHFQRKIKTLTGYSPSEIIRIIRLETARELLFKRDKNITEIAYAIGFTSQSYFTKCYSDHFGHPPSEEVNKTNLKENMVTSMAIEAK